MLHEPSSQSHTWGCTLLAYFRDFGANGAVCQRSWPKSRVLSVRGVNRAAFRQTSAPRCPRQPVVAAECGLPRCCATWSFVDPGHIHAGFVHIRLLARKFLPEFPRSAGATDAKIRDLGPRWWSSSTASARSAGANTQSQPSPTLVRSAR